MRNSLLRNSAAALLFAAAIAPAIAETPEQKGFAIAARADRSDRGFTDSRVEMKMVLRNAAGQEASRTLALNTLEVPDEQLGDKTLIVFDSPADIDGTALLSHAKILDADDQWLYLPALKRIKRISSVNKSGPFVGSEFAFEDFTALELNKYTYKYLREEPCGSQLALVRRVLLGERLRLVPRRLVGLERVVVRRLTRGHQSLLVREHLAELLHRGLRRRLPRKLLQMGPPPVALVQPKGRSRGASPPRASTAQACHLPALE